MGEIPTGVGLLSLKPGRWVHVTRWARRAGREGGGGVQEKKQAATHGEVLIAGAGAAMRESPFKRRLRLAKVRTAGRAPSISCHVESLTKTDTAMKSE